jgi:acetyl-CoA C-acetyltransferase
MPLPARCRIGAALAQAAGRFEDQIVPVEVRGEGGTRLFEMDEHVRAELTAVALAGLKPVFRATGVSSP